MNQLLYHSLTKDHPLACSAL